MPELGHGGKALLAGDSDTALSVKDNAKDCEGAWIYPYSFTPTFVHLNKLLMAVQFYSTD